MLMFSGGVTIMAKDLPCDIVNYSRSYNNARLIVFIDHIIVRYTSYMYILCLFVWNITTLTSLSWADTE